MLKSSLLHTQDTYTQTHTVHTFIRAVFPESSSALFKVIMGLMSRQGTFYYRLISVYYRGCGLMSVLADYVLIQGLDHCQVFSLRIKKQVFVRVVQIVVLVVKGRDLFFRTLINLALSIQYNINLCFLPWGPLYP